MLGGLGLEVNLVSLNSGRHDTAGGFGIFIAISTVSSMIVTPLHDVLERECGSR
jgi:hypothetical protein